MFSSTDELCYFVNKAANMTDTLSTEVNTLLDAVANILYFVTFITNCICVHIMFSTPHLRKTSAFVMYQSCNDALFALVSIILFLGDKSLSETLLISSPGILHSYISYSCIILISVDRWLYLINPQFHSSITAKKIILVIVSSLVISFFLSCPFCSCEHANFVHRQFERSPPIEMSAISSETLSYQF
ncbi:hypothetical protein BgiBS90_033720 [Biomphalaria glabrata]|nr:hypothetical protein BgiBS90_033720 [Biomphalaria glabrata]